MLRDASKWDLHGKLRDDVAEAVRLFRTILSRLPPRDDHELPIEVQDFFWGQSEHPTLRYLETHRHANLYTNPSLRREMKD